MSKRCPDCGFMNDDTRIYCGACGEPLDPNLRLIQQLEKSKNAPSASKQNSRIEPEAPKPEPKKSGDGDVSGKLAKEKKSSPLPWIILGVAVVAVVIAVFVLL